MKQISAKKRAKLTGKGAEHSFVMLPRYILQSRQFIALEPWAKALFMYWAGCFNGYNNGDFSAAKNRFAEFGFNSPITLQKAKVTLVDTGFAVVTRHPLNRRCGLYALTIWPIDDCNGKLELPSERVATHAWKTESGVQEIDLRGLRGVPKPLKKAA